MILLLRIIITIFISGFISGCVTQALIPAEEYRRAEQLVDTGVAHLRENRLDEAQAAFSVAREITPLAAAIDGLGCVAFMRGEFSEAKQLFWQAYDNDSSYDHALGNLAVVYDLMGETSVAQQLFERAILVNPDDVKTRNNFAVFLDGFGHNPSRVEQELLKAAASEELNKDLDSKKGHSIVEENITRLRAAMSQVKISNDF